MLLLLTYFEKETIQMHKNVLLKHSVVQSLALRWSVSAWIIVLAVTSGPTAPGKTSQGPAGVFILFLQIQETPTQSEKSLRLTPSSSRKISLERKHPHSNDSHCLRQPHMSLRSFNCSTVLHLYSSPQRCKNWLWHDRDIHICNA